MAGWLPTEAASFSATGAAQFLRDFDADPAVRRGFRRFLGVAREQARILRDQPRSLEFIVPPVSIKMAEQYKSNLSVFYTLYLLCIHFLSPSVSQSVFCALLPRRILYTFCN